MDLWLSFTPIITTDIVEIAFLHCLLLNKKCFIFCLYISLKFRIFAISFQQLPHSVIDWGTIKNILLSDENNARNIYNTLLVSSFVYNQALLAFISRRLWCSIRYLTLAFCSRLFCFAFHYRFRSGIKFHFSNIPYSAAVHFQIAVFFDMFFFIRQRTTDYSRGGSRNYGIMEIELRCKKTKVVRQKEGSSRNYGITDRTKPAQSS